MFSPSLIKEPLINYRFLRGSRVWQDKARSEGNIMHIAKECNDVMTNARTSRRAQPAGLLSALNFLVMRSTIACELLEAESEIPLRNAVPPLATNPAGHAEFTIIDQRFLSSMAAH